MNTTEKLNRIKEICTANLEIAAKRTPGEWRPDAEDGSYYVYARGPMKGVACEMGRGNATFIASCAGPAEAGWKATIAAIDFITEFHRTKWGWDGDCGLGVYANNMEYAIISAWEDQL